MRESRSRLIAAGDEARRRLERDLHDGAQQRLLAAGLALQVLRGQLTDNRPVGDLLGEAEHELAGALQELRELAAGIHPAVLTDQGLRPALLALASRCPVPLAVRGDPGRVVEPLGVDLGIPQEPYLLKISSRESPHLHQAPRIPI